MNDAPPVTSNILSVQSVHKTYWLGQRPIEVLKDIDFDVEQGEFLALQGASGTGKSTLLHLLGGLDLPDSGNIWFSGENLVQYSRRQLARFRNTQVGFVFQAYHLLPELEALENVCLPARMARLSSQKTAKRGKELLDRVGLSHRKDHRPYELSGGEQQRVAIARALINDPEVIIADEPTGNLDSHTEDEIIELLSQIRSERRVTVLVATHDSRVAAWAPRKIDLVDGTLST